MRTWLLVISAGVHTGESEKYGFDTDVERDIHLLFKEKTY